jgi:FKBP-type peptidyl-prolyl cis-trans isomerase FkpA
VRDIIDGMERIRQRWRLIIVAIVTATCTAACTDAPASPTTTAPFTRTDLLIGTGADALTGATLTVDYTGWLYDASKPDQKGLQFDSSIGRTPFQFTLGSGQVIKGWDQGIPGMRTGGTRRLVIPPSLAYGETRSGPIPPNATLVFDIKLISMP